ncbi:hypothetical protein KAR91_07175, partial [Candidatus Pacearchaeota archaeon]|nr:hypothetical protein [Candidatus Pacearchaeota archaeon]
MSFYDDIINIVDLLDEIVVDDSKTSQNIFKMLLISRSIMYAHYFSDEKSKQYGADEIGDIVHKIDVSVDLKKVYNKDGYTVKSA